MSSFKDTTGRQWLVDITINEVRRVKSLAKLDLLDLENGRSLQALANDPVLLVDVLYILCQDQAQREGLTDEQFGRIFRGDVIESATEALFEALVNFFPPQRQTLLRKVMEMAKAMGQKERQMVETYLESPLIQQAFDKELEKLERKLKGLLTAGNSSTTSPESSESTPESSPSAA